MTLKLFCILILTFISDTFASCGNLRINGGGEYGRLEFQLCNGTWGTVCSNGFDESAAEVACRQLGYYTQRASYSLSITSDASIPTVVCLVDCWGYESRLENCHQLTFCSDYANFYLYCSSHHYDVIIQCGYDQYGSPGIDDPTTGKGSSAGGVAGIVLGVILIFGCSVFVVGCRVYLRYSYARRNSQNRTVVITQRRAPRLLIARVTRSFSSGPPPPPSYTPTDPSADYTPVPARGYQPLSTTDREISTEAPSAPSLPHDDIPSDPPPAYTPPVSADVFMPATPVLEGSIQ